MKISEILERLKNAKKMYGDLEIYIATDEKGIHENIYLGYIQNKDKDNICISNKPF